MANLLLLQAWGTTLPSWNYPAWSVSCEWFVYLLFPLIGLGLNSLRSGVGALLSLILAVALFVLVYGFVFHAHLNFLDDDHRPGLALCRVSVEFVMGGLLYRFLRFTDRPGFPWSLLAGALVAAGVGAGGDGVDLVLVTAFLVIIAAASRQDTGIAKVLAWRPLVYCGEISYALYMVHAPIQMTIGKVAARMLQGNDGLTPKGIVVGLATVALTMACAAVAHHGVEIPARSWWRKRLAPVSPVKVPGQTRARQSRRQIEAAHCGEALTHEIVLPVAARYGETV